VAVPTENWRFAHINSDGSVFNLSSTGRLPWFEVRAADVLAIWPSTPRAADRAVERPTDDQVPDRAVESHIDDQVTDRVVERPTDDQVRDWLQAYHEKAKSAGAPPPKLEGDAFPRCEHEAGATWKQMKAAIKKVPAHLRRPRGLNR
jgi:hypothetical protein